MKTGKQMAEKAEKLLARRNAHQEQVAQLDKLAGEAEHKTAAQRAQRLQRDTDAYLQELITWAGGSR